jgi:hypothetical protein
MLYSWCFRCGPLILSVGSLERASRLFLKLSRLKHSFGSLSSSCLLGHSFFDLNPRTPLAFGRAIFLTSRTELGRVEEAIGAGEIDEAWLVADFIRTSIARPVFDLFGSQPMLAFRSTPDVS